MKAAGIWGQAGGGARVPTGAGHLLSRQNMKGGSVLIPSQEEVKRRRTRWRRESAKKLLAWMDFALAAAHPGHHIPEENPPDYIPSSSTEVDTPSYWTHSSGPDELALDCISTISCVALGRLCNLSEPPLPNLNNGNGNSHHPGLVRRCHETPRACFACTGCSKHATPEASSHCWDYIYHNE